MKIISFHKLVRMQNFHRNLIIYFLSVLFYDFAIGIVICCAMSSQDVLHYVAQTRMYNWEYFCTFLDEEVMQMLAERRVADAVLIVDNVRFHKDVKVQNRVEGRGRRITYIPPTLLF